MMRSMRAVAALALLVMPLAAAAQQKSTGAQAPSAKSEPSLVDTLTFIRQTLESYGTLVYPQVAGPFQNITNKLSSTAAPCNIKIDLDWFVSPQADKPPERTQGEVYEIALASIDPQRVATNEVKLSVGGYLVTLTTTNNAPVIQDRIVFFQRRSDGQSLEGQVSKRAHADIGITATPEDASRLANAFSHAVVLCGGKPSAF